MNETETNETTVAARAKLTPIQIRVLGCLMEKEIATPEYYPLTLNALVAACNQKSNRNPAMTLDETTVIRTLEDLRYEEHLVMMITSSGGRVAKYKHTLLSKWEFTPQEVAVLCELFLRGPQTVGELRTRTERLFPFNNTSEVEATLTSLTEWGGGTFVVKLPREPGCREQRWAHLFSGEVVFNTSEPDSKPEPARLIVQAENERIAALEAEVASLRTQVDQLLADFATFRKQFE
jgi:uncharacterized protein YceH (UPF0502 family)